MLRMSLIMRAADFLYAAFRHARDIDAGACENCGTHVDAQTGTRGGYIYCSKECAEDHFLSQQL